MNINDQVVFIAEGDKFSGRSGFIKDFCSAAFKEYCRVQFYKQGRERKDKTRMVLIENLTVSQP